MTEPSGRWRLGLALALATTILWGTLPVVLKMLLAGMDAPTITWYRFSIATAGLGLYLVLKRSFPTPRGSFWLLGLAAAALCANHLIFLFGLDRISPETAQVVIQLAPMFSGSSPSTGTKRPSGRRRSETSSPRPWGRTFCSSLRKTS